MSVLAATVEGIGFWANGLPDWASARAYVQGAAPVDNAPARPSPQLLAPNERRRAPDTVAVALEVALAACHAAGRVPSDLPSVFASTHGDPGITDYMCATLVSDARAVSPTRFHNSVHNAAAGYWTIGTGCTQATTAISAFDATFAQALIEALLQLHVGAEAVLLAAYDGATIGPLATVTRSAGLLGGALVLSRRARRDAPRIEAELRHDPLREGGVPGRLERIAKDNAMVPMLPLFEALAHGQGDALHPAGAARVLHVRVAHHAVAHEMPALAGIAHG